MVDGEVVGGHVGLLFPIGVPAIDRHLEEKVQSDTSKVRLWFGNGNLTIDSIYHKK